MIFWSFVKMCGDSYFMYPSYGKYVKICSRFGEMTGKESEKSLKESLDLDGTSSGFLSGFLRSKETCDKEIEFKEKLESQHVIFGKSLIFMKKKRRNIQKSAPKVDIPMDIPMTWRWRRLFDITNDRC